MPSPPAAELPYEASVGAGGEQSLGLGAESDTGPFGQERTNRPLDGEVSEVLDRLSSREIIAPLRSSSGLPGANGTIRYLCPECGANMESPSDNDLPPETCSSLE